MKNKKTLTIGICAFNEEKNIGFLLDSLLRQKIKSAKLEKIIILSDASNDRTNKIIEKYHLNNRKIIGIYGKNRKGKIFRLNQLYKLVSSDYLVTLDADVNMGNFYVIERLISQFKKNIGLLNANVLPMDPETFFEKIVVAYEHFWKKTTNQIDNGNNINNSLGCMLGLSKDFYKKLIIPDDVVADDHFIYIKAQDLGFKCKFVKNATVYYRAPQNIDDYSNQFSRYYSSGDKVKSYFTKNIDKYYEVPRMYKIKAYISSIKSEPIYIAMALFLQIWHRNFLYKQSQNHIYWDAILSSK